MLLDLAAAVVGLAAGSFLNVVIHRVPRKESVIRPRSHCPACGAPVADRDNIPVVSWVLLRGRCRSCGAPISARYPLVELGTAGLFAGVAARYGLSAELPAFCVFAAAMLALALVDLEHFLLPSRIIYSTLAAEIVLLTLGAAIGHHWANWSRGWVAGAVAFLCFFVIHFIYPAGMAWGDLRMAGLIGAVLGWRGYGYVFSGLFLAFVGASVVGIVLVLARRASGKTPIPFGVFLAGGALVSLFSSHPVLNLHT